jgi:hypothetical protein
MSWPSIVGSERDAQVALPASGHFEAVMHLTDAFVTFQPMDTRMRVSSITEAKNRTALRVGLSPQADDHEIWSSLEAAVAGIRKPQLEPKGIWIAQEVSKGFQLLRQRIGDGQTFLFHGSVFPF